MGEPRDRDERSGKYRSTITDADVLAAVRAHEPAATSEVGDELGITRQGADQRLRRLRDDGRVNSKKIAASLVWFSADESAAAESDDQSPTSESKPRDDAPADDPDGVPGMTDPMLEADDEFAQLVNDVADDVLPGSDAKLEARREALHAVVEYLREHETATPADFRNDVYPAHNGQYTDGDDPARSWWNNAMYKGLKEIAERTDAVEKASTTGEWSYQSVYDE